MIKTFFAWADTVSSIALVPGRFAEHTWVTTYEHVLSCPPDPVDGEYWYCRGDCRTTPPQNKNVRLLGVRSGDTAFAIRVGVPNDESCNMGLRYGVHGVCHQMANRLLRATGIDGGPPLTVANAKGYLLSEAMFGVYGGKGARGRPIREAWDRLVDDWQQS